MSVSTGSQATASIDQHDMQVADLLAKMPDAIRRSFTVEQLDAMAGAMGSRQAEHAVRLQATAPVWPGRKVYLALFLGSERRNSKRLEREGQTRALRLLTALGGVFFLVFGAFCGLYLLKSLTGINLMSGQSPLHPLYALMIER